MKTIIAATLLLFAVISCSGQNSSAHEKGGLQGTVIADPHSSTSGARAALINVHTLRVIKVVAAQNGRFFLKDLEAGDYVLVVAPRSDSSCAESAVERAEVKADSITLVKATLNVRNCK